MNSQTLKRMRRKLGLSQQAMAFRLGVSLRTYHGWERGEGRIRKMAIAAIKAMANEK